VGRCWMADVSGPQGSGGSHPFHVWCRLLACFQWRLEVCGYKGRCLGRLLSKPCACNAHVIGTDP
jgi:hypothetical protein